MTITSRPYSSEDDWKRMMELLAAAWKPEGLETVETIGSYSWWRRNPGWEKTLQLWEDERSQLAAVSSLESGNLEIHLNLCLLPSR